MQWNAFYYNFVNVQINNSQIVILNINTNKKGNKVEYDDAISVANKNTAAAAIVAANTADPGFKMNPMNLTTTTTTTIAAKAVENIEAIYVENTNIIKIIIIIAIIFDKSEKFIRQKLELQQQNGFQLPNNHQHQSQSGKQQQQQKYSCVKSIKPNTSIKVYQINYNMLIYYYYLCYSNSNYLYFLQQNLCLLKNNFMIILLNKTLTILLEKYIFVNFLINLRRETLFECDCL